MTERTAGLQYAFQSGALNESWSDVFGEIIEQWHENPRAFGTTAGAQAADWLIGEDVFTPGVPGDGLRSMKNPGSGYSGDPQPGHMRDYKRMSRFQDHGGVHYNSGIPNRAAYEAAVRIGSEKVAKIWYRALTDYLRPSAQFTDAAAATIRAASELFTAEPAVAQAVTDAWTAVGVIGPNAIKVPTTVSAQSSGTDHRHRHLAAPDTTGAAPSMSAGRNPGIVPPWLTPPAR